MPLIEQTMTEKNLQAHQRNAQQSHGAATPEGKERARGANLRHGYYSEMRDQALVALGDDPEGLAALAEGARQQFRPANAYQEWITDRIASLQWRIERAERRQESKAASHIWKRESKRREAARQLREQCAEVQDFLDSVRRAAARPDFYAPAGCFELCQQMMEKNPCPNMDQIHDLLHQLREPRRFCKPLPPPLPDAMSDREWHDTLKEDTTDEPVVPDSVIPVAEGSDRDPLREQLWNLAATERRRVAEGWGKEIAAHEAPLSPRARDLCVIEISKDLELLRREERSCVREFSRLTKELRNLQKEAVTPQPQARTSDQPAHGQNSTTEDSAGEDITENAGASGYVEENKCERPSNVSTKRPPAPTQRRSEASPSHDVLTDLRPVAPAVAHTGVLPANGRGGAPSSPRSEAA
jgi:hypothetical protein